MTPERRGIGLSALFLALLTALLVLGVAAVVAPVHSTAYAYDATSDNAPASTPQLAHATAAASTATSRATSPDGASSSRGVSVVAAETASTAGSELPPAVIGEGMTSRVVPFAEANGYETYAGLENPQNYTSEELLAHNSAQIETWMNEGRTIYDVGPEPGRAFYPMETSPNYGMEHNLVRGYGGYQPVTLPGEANWWELLNVP